MTAPGTSIGRALLLVCALAGAAAADQDCDKSCRAAREGGLILGFGAGGLYLPVGQDEVGGAGLMAEVGYRSGRLAALGDVDFIPTGGEESYLRVGLIGRVDALRLLTTSNTAFTLAADVGLGEQRFTWWAVPEGAGPAVPLRTLWRPDLLVGATLSFDISELEPNVVHIRLSAHMTAAPRPGPPAPAHPAPASGTDLGVAVGLVFAIEL
jgi:hypothetical protein